MTGPLTVVLDDDPTGSQSASGVRVVLAPRGAELREALHDGRSVYVLTNTRALPERDAVELVRHVRDEVRAVASELGRTARIVLRGDSTLRGHVFAETDVVADDADAVVVFAPAFPAGGRTTLDGVHRVRIDGRDVPAAETEYAADPVFPFGSSHLGEYVAEKSSRPAVLVEAARVRGGELADVIRTAPAGAVIVPDIVDDSDVRAVADAVRAAELHRPVVVRCAAPLAADLAGVTSPGLLEPERARADGPVLLVVGSHTDGATGQLARLGVSDIVVELDTDRALADPDAEGRRAAQAAAPVLRDGGFAVVTTARRRRTEHDSLTHGARVMRALTTAVRELADSASLVVAKGGITSADVATVGLGAQSAWVVGQLEPGVSLWRIATRAGRELDYVVVPGNVGGPELLERLLGRIRGTASTPHTSGAGT